MKLVQDKNVQALGVYFVIIKKFLDKLKVISLYCCLCVNLSKFYFFLEIEPVNMHISKIIIQQIVTLSKYGHDALDICHP